MLVTKYSKMEGQDYMFCSFISFKHKTWTYIYIEGRYSPTKYIDIGMK